MKKIYLAFLALMMMAMLPKSLSAAANIDVATTITWPFSLGTAGQLATFSEGTADYFATNYVEAASNLTFKAANLTYAITFTQFQPVVAIGAAATTDGLVSFNLRNKTGLNFTPTKVTFDCLRYGTDGGSIDVIWKASDGTRTTIATALKPARNNSGAATHAVYDLSTLTTPITASNGLCGLEIYIYNLGNTKQIGIANVIIEGKTQGTPITVVTHTLATAVSPVGSGTVTVNPVGSVFDDSTAITLTAKRAFGYNFAYWSTATGDSVSGANPFTFALRKDTALTAVFRKINTYSLTVNTAGGGKSYMVTATPAATVVDGLSMYEDGTTVTLTTANNPVILFTNWSSGETSSSLVLNMTKNQEVTANFSAIDYIVGWDFYKNGNGGRPADFFANTENESAALVLRDSAGTATTWLDKSQLAAGGYEGQPAAVNWTPLANKNYYQVSFTAKDYTNLKVQSKMLFNYNAYSVQRCEYSLDGLKFDTLGTITMSSAKVWYANTFPLPAQADHADRVYIRWIPDYASAIVGTTALANDGTAISGIYVTATATIFNDGVAPILVSSVPANGATGASATGKIVLTFDEKIKLADDVVTATLGTQVLTPVLSGKTMTFAYSGLQYNTVYTFRLDTYSVSDLADNIHKDAIEFQFTTMNKPTVTKKSFDFIVGTDGDFKAALTAAQAASAKGERFYIFFPDGQYNIGANTGDANQMTTISVPKVSYVGEHSDSVVVYNKSTQESINSTATMYFTSAVSNVYMQDISLMNKMDYRTGTLIGRGVALWDQSSKSIYKNVKLLSNQDTYYTGGDRSYLETCDIHGTVDFICGGGDIFFNECLLYLEDRSGNCLTAPATNSNWGYVFKNCTIDGFSINNGSYRLGRPWSNAPKAVYINTTMNVLPAAAGWGDPMNVVPSVFAEYNSLTSSGATIDLSTRRTSYTLNSNTVTLNPVLTAEQAAQYTLANVLGGSDTWQPNLYTEQAAAPVISVSGSKLNWDDSNYVLCWAVCKNGKFVKFVTTNSYDIPAGTADGTVFTVRSANEMGGLSGASNKIAYVASGLQKVTSSVVSRQYFSLDGRALVAPVKGMNIIRTRYSDGSVKVTKEMHTSLLGK
jgi:pectin methylesterase-like acyl-CoA thioesterase